MTDLERHLEEMGILPKPEPKQEPKPAVRDYEFKLPHLDENGEPPF